MDTKFNISNTYFGPETASLRDLLNCCAIPTAVRSAPSSCTSATRPKSAGCRKSLESIRSTPNFTAEKKKHILERLTAAEGLERYLHTKYVGQKRFSLEGGETFIASMDEIIQRAGEKGVQEIVIGMAHRGRLNVLVNTLGKAPELFEEFEGKHADDLPAGDVKYHQGFSSDISTPGGPVHLSLAFNPSHLEIVNPVVEGSVKARMDRRGDQGQASAADPGARRRRLRRPGRGDGNPEPGADPRLRHRRHRAHRHQQPDRFHHLRPARRAFDHLLLRRRQDDRSAGAARQRRRSGSRRVWHRRSRWITAPVPEGRRCRHHLLPQAGPQRAGHPGADPAADVQEDRQHPGTRKLYADKLAAQTTIPADGGDRWLPPTATPWTPASTPSIR
jgi:2-oxoglutarate dehydrogenase E1 component